jgi:segregation and condensation protein A
MAIDVHLEMFEGPLDLLLFLIKKDDLDIYNIPISKITAEYLQYLELMKELNLDVAGEFLVLAATLMSIKAKTLLPSQEVEENEGPDPRAELVAKLVEYQKFKQAAAFLEKRADEFKDVFYRGVPTFDESEKSLSISTFDLMSALREVLDRAEDADKKEVLGEEFPIEEKIEKILALLQTRKGMVTWDEIFSGERKRRGIISCFLALLELTKLQKIFIRQDENFAKITIFKKEAPADAPSASDAPAAAPDGRGS